MDSFRRPNSPENASAARPVRTDEELLAAYRSTGDRQAFAELVHRYERELYSYLRRFLADPTQAEDAFQATFLQVHLKCEQFEAGRRVKPWLYTIATNQAIDLQRRSRRHKLVSLDQRSHQGGDDVGALLDLVQSREEAPSASLDDEEKRGWVQAAVEALPENLRAAVALIYFQGLKYREAAEALGVPVGTVKSRLHAAILKLNQAWNTAHPNQG